MASLTGSTTAVFFVRLSAAVDEIVDVDWSTRDGTAIAGKDYEAASGTVSFLPGEIEKTIDVIVYGQDDVSANGKKFYIELKPPANAVLTDALAECVITVEDQSGVLVTSLVIAQGKRGLKGNPGLSAYEQAVLMGYAGTVEQWMEDQVKAGVAADTAGEYAAEAAASAAIAGQHEQASASYVSESKQYVDSALSDLSTAANKFYPTLVAANADIANISVNQPVTVGETTNGGLWYKATAGATSLTKSLHDPLNQAKVYADANAVFKPLLNPIEKNLNNVGYGAHYYSISGDITLANSFPIANNPSYVLTYSVAGSAVKYQRAILPFSDPVRIFDRSFSGTWSVWTEMVTRAQVLANESAIAANATSISDLDSRVFSQIGRNLLDKSKIVGGEYFSIGSNKIVLNAAWRRSGFIPVQAGKTYTISGNLVGGPIAWYATADKNATAISYVNAASGTAPVGAKFAVIGITNNSSTSYDNTVQFEEGSVATTYEQYKEYIDPDNVKDSVRASGLFDAYSKNLLDPSRVNFIQRYSTGTKNLITDTLGIAASPYIPVEEGEWYVVSGEALYGGAPGVGQGGLFTSAGATTAVQNITFVAPVDNKGAAFQVPTGMGITHAVVSLRKLNDLAASTTLQGVVQVERGEQATAYEPFSISYKIKQSLIPSYTPITPSTGGFDDTAWFEYFKADGGKIFQDKLPNFRKHHLLKDKDIVVVNTGTSLTARSTEHCTDHLKANERPPLMHSNNFASLLWDAMKWDGQKYRRYDYSGAFTETGSFITSSNLAEWDDGAYRAGLTRYSSTSNASVSFTIPINAWQFNFIYRTDSLGCNAKVTIAEGPGKVQVFDEVSQAWVEANNYEFSQLEAAPVTRTVAVPYPATGVTTNYILASKGNTTYQKRLKMRCRSTDGTLDSRSSAKSVTIARVGGGARFMYWGVEWSQREHMITFINAARGSHCTYAIHAVGLPRFQDNEIWSFKPDLILSELGIHNDGASNADPAPVGYWSGLAKNYVTDTTYELSMYSRAANFGLTPEYAFFTASITWNFNGIDDNGELKYALQPASTNGPAKMMNALDKYQEASEYLNSVGVPCIDAAKRWVEAGNAIFGGLKNATVASGKNGATFTNEGSHWNDTGSKIMAKAVIPVIE